MTPSSNPSTVQSSRRTMIYELVTIFILAVLLTVTLIAVTTGWILNSNTVPHAIADQKTHLAFAITMSDTGKPPIAHFLYQASVIGIHLIVRDSNWLLSATLVNLLPQIFLGILIYIALRIACQPVESHWSQRQKWFVRCICVVLALGLTIAEPIFSLLTAVDGLPNQLLLGFVPPLTYHNPTMTLMRPFALALYVLITVYLLPVRQIRTSHERILLPILLLIATTVLCGLSKPNYLLALLPAVMLWLAWSLWRKNPVNWKLALVSVLLSIILVLAWQYLFTYVNPTQELDRSGGIEFAPFKVVLGISGSSVEIMILRFIVSILFPLSVYLVWWKSATRNTALNFAWLTFIFGAFLMYFLAEKGDRWQDGNFFWSGYITIFVLYVASVRFAFQKWLEHQPTGKFRLDWRTTVLVILFSLHILSGLTYITTLNQELYAAMQSSR